VRFRLFACTPEVRGTYAQSDNDGSSYGVFRYAPVRRASKNDEESSMVSGRAATRRTRDYGQVGFIVTDSLFIGAHGRAPLHFPSVPAVLVPGGFFDTRLSGEHGETIVVTGEP